MLPESLGSAEPWLKVTAVETIVTAAFVTLPQNVKCPVLGNRLFNPDSVHDLLGNFAINFLAPYPFFVSTVQLKHDRLHKTLFCYCLHYFDCTNKHHFRLSDCSMKIFCYWYSTFNIFSKK